VKKKSAETRKKMSEAKKWKKHSKETILKMSKTKTGKGRLINWLWKTDWCEKTWKSKNAFYKLLNYKAL